MKLLSAERVTWYKQPIATFFGEEGQGEKKKLEGKVSCIVADVPWGLLKCKNQKSVIMRCDQVFQPDIDAIADGVALYLADNGTYRTSI